MWRLLLLNWFNRSRPARASCCRRVGKILHTWIQATYLEQMFVRTAIAAFFFFFFYRPPTTSFSGFAYFYPNSKINTPPHRWVYPVLSRVSFTVYFFCPFSRIRRWNKRHVCEDEPRVTLETATESGDGRILESPAYGANTRADGFQSHCSMFLSHFSITSLFSSPSRTVTGWLMRHISDIHSTLVPC